MTEQVTKKNFKDNIVVLIVSLAVIAAIAAGVLAMVDYITQKPREEAALKSTLAAFRKLQPEFNNDPELGKTKVYLSDGKWKIISSKEKTAKITDLVIFYPAEKDGKLISIIAQTVTNKGYGGDMTVLMSMTPKGIVENVVVTENKETPGLGTAVFDRTIKKSIWGILKGEYKDSANKLAPNPILDYFSGKEYVPNSVYDSSDKSNPDIIPASKWQVQKDGGAFKYVTGSTITSRAVTFAVKQMVSVYYETQKQVLSNFSKSE
ncbi:MAG: FMN-binding protein [bacterium]|nr:FMN-binding protein [bacterium]